MKLRFAALMFVNVWAVGLAGSVWSAAAEPVSLFDGRTLDGWNVIGCEAVVQDGAILLKAGNGLVQTARSTGFHPGVRMESPERGRLGLRRLLSLCRSPRRPALAAAIPSESAQGHGRQPG